MSCFTNEIFSMNVFNEVLNHWVSTIGSWPIDFFSIRFLLPFYFNPLLKVSSLIQSIQIPCCRQYKVFSPTLFTYYKIIKETDCLQFC